MPSKLEARVTEHDRQIAAIRKLILAGMKMINESQSLARESQALARENQAQIKALAAAQHETDRMLKGLIRSRERGRHGHSKTDIR
jgi:hypothetical protein